MTKTREDVVRGYLKERNTEVSDEKLDEIMPKIKANLPVFLEYLDWGEVFKRKSFGQKRLNVECLKKLKEILSTENDKEANL